MTAISESAYKLPFGISSAPKLFLKHTSKLLEVLEGVVCHDMDDVVVAARDVEQHARPQKFHRDD